MPERTLDYYKFNDLYKTPDTPGLYAWFVAPTSDASISDYQDVFRSKVYSAEVKSSLGEAYQGNLIFKESINTKVPNHRMLLKASLAFSPPIYIGISVNLNHRLSTHAEALSSMLNDHRLLSEAVALDGVERDTDSESGSFAARISLMLRERSLDQRSLFVRTATLEDGCSYTDLIDVEHVLNRTFFPHFGLR